MLAYECRMATLEVTDTTAAGAAGAAVAPGLARQAEGTIGFQGEMAALTEIEGMFAHLEEALVAIEFLNPDSPRKLMPRLRRLFARTQLETEEVNILRGIARQILAPKQHKKQERKSES